MGQNRVYEVDPMLGAVIAAWGGEAELELLRREHGDDFCRAVDELQAARAEEGLFGQDWPRLEPAGDLDIAPPDTGHLTMSVTEQCNLRCRYCPYTCGDSGDRPHRDVHMSLDTALSALRLLRRPGPDESPATVSFYGGEPLLRFDLIREVVREIRRADGDRPTRVKIDTNGVLVDDAIADFVVSEEIFLQISLDGPAEVHDRYRRDRAGRPSHAAAVAGVERILLRDPAANQRMVFSATLAPPYDLMAVIDYFADFPPYREHGVDPNAMAWVRFADLPGPESAWPDKPGALVQSRRRELHKAAAAYAAVCREGRRGEAPRALLQLFDQDLIRYHHRQRGPLAAGWTPGGCCRPGGRNLHVRANGVLQPCERLGSSFTMGTVEAGPDLAAVARMHREFNAAVANRCAGCWAVRLCDMCFTPLVATWTDDASAPAVVPEAACAAVRSRAAHTLRLHTALATAGDDALSFLENSVLL